MELRKLEYSSVKSAEKFITIRRIILSIWVSHLKINSLIVELIIINLVDLLCSLLIFKNYFFMANLLIDIELIDRFVNLWIKHDAIAKMH